MRRILRSNFSYQLLDQTREGYYTIVKLDRKLNEKVKTNEGHWGFDVKKTIKTNMIL